MRTLTATAIAELAKKLGTEPVTILEVQWTDGGSIHTYGDSTDAVNGVDGRILEMSGMDNVITINGVTAGTTGESSQLSVTLDDRDGQIKSILDQNDVHKRSVFVYQWFPNLAFSDRFLLYKGQVSSPLDWDEGDRTVRFDIINELEDAEIGFSVEEGDIEFAPDDLTGKAWPLVFGTCVHIPALKLRQSFSGVLLTGFGIHDFTIACKLDQLNNMCCPLTFSGWRTVRSPTIPGSVTLIATFQEESGCKCRRLSQIQQWELDLTTQRGFEVGSLEILNGDLFPQGVSITLDICNAKVFGKFNGTDENPSTTFVVSKYVHPKASELTCPETTFFLGCNVRESSVAEGGSSLGGGQFNARDEPTNFNTGINPLCGSEFQDRTNLGWDYLATFPTADFFWAETGCEVFLDGDQEIVYVVNLLPSTILRVAAFRTFESGVRELVTVPASLYTSRVSDFNGYMVTELVFTDELSRRGEGWEDEIFVSQTSSVGPNTVDILEWLIDKYTNFTTDAASFADVESKLENYPSHFPILERRNIFDVLKDIAFQARCALYLRNDVFTLLYLSEEPSTDFDITETDVLPRSLIMTHTETEDLVTKFIAEWKYDYAIQDPNKVILRYNIKRYGTQEETFDFFIYNIRELVEKSATFWLIRMANTWRRLKFKTPISKLESEVFDVANVTLTDFTPDPVKCVVEKATYDSEELEMEFELWTPVRAGETSQFIFSWPSQIDIDNIWPTLEDQNEGNAGGSGPNVDVTAPALHPLSRPDAFQGATLKKTSCSKIGQGSAFEAASSVFIDGCRDDHGDKKPSDKDDEKPDVKVPGDGEGANPEGKNPDGSTVVGSSVWIENQFKTENEADQADQTVRNELANDGDSESGNESGKTPSGNAVEQLPCPEDNEGDPPDCTVRCQWFEQTLTKVVLGGVITECGEMGVPLAADDHGEQVLYFDSLQAAISACSAIQGLLPTELDEFINCNTYPISGKITVPLSDQAAWFANNCDETQDEENPTATGYCPSAAVKDGAGTGSDIAQTGLEGGLGV
jgi:hypothetical protein